MIVLGVGVGVGVPELEGVIEGDPEKLTVAVTEGVTVADDVIELVRDREGEEGSEGDGVPVLEGVEPKDKDAVGV